MFHKISQFLFLPLIMFSISSCDSQSQKTQTSASTQKSEYVPGEVIVSLKPQTRKSQLNIASSIDGADDFQVQAVTTLDYSGRFLKLKLKPAESVDAAISRLQQQNNIEFAQPNYIYHTTAVPNDPQYSRQWGLKNTGQTVTGINVPQDQILAEQNPGISGDDISAEKAWDIITDCSGVTIAVLDSGVKLDHEDIVNNLWSDPSGHNGYDFVDNDNLPNDFFMGHGTHVTTTIAGEGNNGKGSTGVCWKAKVMPVRVLGNDGSGTTATALAGISYAVTNGAKIINMSFGGGAFDPAEYAAVQSATNTLFVVAAGNSSTDNSTTAFYPCNFSLTVANMICVAAVDQDFSLASYSNFSTSTPAVQVAAPGTNIFAGTPSAVTSTNYTSVSETFTSGWTVSSDGGSPNWGYGAAPASLINPTNYNGTSNLYANNLNSYSYKSFSNVFTSYKNILMEFTMKFDLAISDSLEIAVDRSNINLFSTQTPYFWASTLSGAIHGSGAFEHSPDLSAHDAYMDFSSICGQQLNCTVGFKLQTDASAQSYGIQISNMQFVVLNDAYKIISGTSMATPQVTGVAGLVWSYNPTFTVADVKNAILNGGRAAPGLVGKVSTGKVLNAMGALSYLAKPSTPVISVQ